MCGCISSSEQANATVPLTQLNGRPTRALTRAPQWRTDRPLTVQDIARMRSEFWETRVEGNPQTWAALHVVADTVVAGDIAQANALLEVRHHVSHRVLPCPGPHRRRCHLESRRPTSQRLAGRCRSATTSAACSTASQSTASRTRPTCSRTRRSCRASRGTPPPARTSSPSSCAWQGCVRAQVLAGGPAPR